MALSRAVEANFLRAQEEKHVLTAVEKQELIKKQLLKNMGLVYKGLVMESVDFASAFD